MPPKPTVSAPWQALEEQAYHAYREWHVWLVLRERELGERLAVGRPTSPLTKAASAAQPTERNPTVKEGTP